jgi:hypothetical protein
MNRLPREIILVVCSIFKKHKYILNFLSINTEMHELKTKVDFDKEWVLYENVVNLSYKTNIKRLSLVGEIPKDIDQFYPLSILCKTSPIHGFCNIPSIVKELSFDSLVPVLKVRDIPSTILSLDLGEKCSSCLIPNVIPNSVTTLILSTKYNYPLHPGDIPNSVTFLNMGIKYNRDLMVGSLPANLTHLYLSKQYNRPLGVHILPDSVTKLYFGDFFNQPISLSVLPKNLRSVYFGYYFDQPLVENAFPPTTRKIVFGDSFNQPIREKMLPPNLEFLQFGEHFNQAFLSVGILPTSLKYIIFHKKI